jgi:hypothetical protein
MLRRFLPLSAATFVALSLPAPAQDVFGPGWGLDELRPLTAASAFAAHDTLADGSRVVFDGSIAWIEADDGTVGLILGQTPVPAFASFVEVDPGGTFALLGESSNGVIYRAALSGGGLVPLATLAGNYDLAFESSASALISAATCGLGCGNSLWRLQIASGVTALVASVPGPSGPLALSPAGDLHYALQSDAFPTPPGSISIVAWSAGQLANGPFPLTVAQALPFASGLDGAGSLVFDPDFGHLFVTEAAFGGTSRVLELDRFGARVGVVATTIDYPGKLEVLDAPGAGALAAFQPAGRRLFFRTTDFNQGTSRISKASPRRPQLACAPNGDGTMTCALTGGTPNTAGYVVFGNLAVFNPVESAYDQARYLLWSGLPYSGIRRAGLQFPLDAGGAGSFTFQNGGIAGTRVLQVLVRDAAGFFRGASTPGFN